ncbi:CIA30 family protein [Sulfitobacter sp. JB4-11]|uniref:CIA30 family protein n=1 Tax=Sulfitobacter rhodophyticola TaxID=3238304 RepID=UPI003511580A
MNLTPDWEYVADRVMGGVSSGQISAEVVEGQDATRLTGDVSLDNNGGFVQMAFDLQPDGSAFDASAFEGVEISVFGNGEAYDLRLRTDQLTRPWQSFRTDFNAPPEWTTLRIPFDTFQSHKTDATFDPARLRRIGILAIGREFSADVSVARIALY